MTNAQKDTRPSGLRATFLGVSTILFDNDSESVLIDGFFTRPSYFSIFVSKISSNEEKVIQCMKKAGIDERLKAVFVAHSHYDHALDAPVVCKQTGAKLVGSGSTQMIGKAHGLLDDQILVVEDGQVLTFGSFKITVIEGIHSPGDISPGDITEPLHTPCPAKWFRSGKCYSYFIEHGQDRIFVHPSANFVPGKLERYKASTLFLGVGVLGKQSEEFRRDYWKHVVEAVSPEKIYPIHWDNFFRSLDVQLAPMPWIFDNWSITDRYLKEKTSLSHIKLQFLQTWEVVKI